MGERCNIGYVDSSINPIRGCLGCELWKPGNHVCYAGRLISSWSGNDAWPEEFTKPVLFRDDFAKSLGWSDLAGTDRPEKPWLNGYPRICFVNDMSDTWGEFYYTSGGQKTDLPVDWFSEYMEVLTSSPHIYLWLTKRPKRAVEFFKDIHGSVPKNFWVGTSITSPNTLNRALELSKLAEICDGKLWLSLEPLYGQANITPFLPAFDWVVTGGESGPNPIKSEIDHLASVVDDCQVKGVRVFVKQLGSDQGAGPKGERLISFPKFLQVRQMPDIGPPVLKMKQQTLWETLWPRPMLF